MLSELEGSREDNDEGEQDEGCEGSKGGGREQVDE